MERRTNLNQVNYFHLPFTGVELPLYYLGAYRRALSENIGSYVLREPIDSEHLATPNVPIQYMSKHTLPVVNLSTPWYEIIFVPRWYISQIFLTRISLSYTRVISTNMAKKNKISSPPEAPELTEQQAPTEAFVSRAVETAPHTSVGKRLTIKFGEGGEILWDRMTDEQKNLFASTVSNDPTALELIGLAAGQGETIPTNMEGVAELPPPPPIEIKPREVEGALKMISKVSAWALKLGMRRFSNVDMDPEILSAAFKYDPEVLSDLTEKGTYIANKYAPEILKKYYNEITFISIFAWAISQQCQAAIAAQAIKDMTAKPRPKPDHQKPSVVTPTTEERNIA